MKEQVFTSIPLDDLADLIQSCVRDEIKSLVGKDEGEKLIKTEEAAQFLGVSKVTLLSWRKKGIIPFHQLNSRIYFKKSELLKAMEQRSEGSKRKRKK